MPEFEVTAPDGRSFIVTAPEGASQDEVLRYAQQNMPAAQPARPTAQPNTGLGRVLTGMGDPLRGAEQIAARVQAGNADNWMQQLLRGNPNLAAAAEAAGPAGRMETPAQVDARVQRREADYQASRAAAGDTGMDWYRAGGQMLTTLPAAAALPTGGTILGSVAAGGASGAALNALQPVTDPNANYGDTLKQNIEQGGVIGAATGPLGLMLGRAVAPRVPQPVRDLADAGVQMTPGQMIGGMARRVEDIAASVPVVGETVRNARRASIDSFNTAVGNRVLAPLGEAVPQGVSAGRDLVEHVGSTISRYYDDAIARANPFGPDRQFVQDLAQIGQQFLTPASRTEYNNIVRDSILSRMQGGQIDPAIYQIIRSDLGRLAREFGSSQEFRQREMATAFRSLQGAFDDLLARANPAIAPQIQAANQAYAGFVRMADAGGRVGAVDGVFTPAQLSNAVRANDRSIRRGAYARGDALLQDMSDPARAVLPQVVPDSGTPERMALMGLLGGGANVLGLLSLPQLAAGAAAYGAYSAPAQRVIQAAIMAPRSSPIRAAGDAIAASGGAVSVPLGGLLLSPPPPERLQERR